MTSDVLLIRPDDHGLASLDGVWDFFPADSDVGSLDTREPAPIRVPALWEAEGWLELDGPAWYRRRFQIHPETLPGWWTLRFGAVMDVAEVHLDRRFVGSHDTPFTPFELDVTDALREGENELAVRVVDHPLDSPEHLRSPHGKQGWANRAFPSRPSLYMTYGGIWQPVTLRRHGPVRIDDVYMNSDPDNLVATVTLSNVSSEVRRVRLGVRTVGVVREREVSIDPSSQIVAVMEIGATVAAHWTPSNPVLHRAWVDVIYEDGGTDAREVRYGLRVVRVDGQRLLIDDVPYRMTSVLVQGFRPDALYAEGDRDAIVDEVRAAQAMGFNTLRLHIKAFEPTYLDVCDELGMLLHCDVPIAEPIDYAELGDDTELAERCTTAAREQIRRDRNHPSVILWSAMNELTLDGLEWRGTENYERFARVLATTVTEADPTRPFIENDWVEPDPERVFLAPVLTAHWYGRLHADYLDKLAADCARWADTGKPLFVTEFGDWGLPEMPQLVEAPFWDARAVYAAGLAASLWPGSVERFVVETQRYQGISDRVQGEVFRRHDHIGGYCLTELTDVPHEFNGVLDLRRRPKPIAVAEVARLNQTVLPMLELDSLVVEAGSKIHAPLHIANDGEAQTDVEVWVRFSSGAGAGEGVLLHIGALPAYRAGAYPGPRLSAPDVPGNHDLIVELRARDRVIATNKYSMHVVECPAPQVEVQVHGGPGSTPLHDVIEQVGGRVGSDGPLVVAESGLDEDAGAALTRHLSGGGTALVLAQEVEAEPHYPVPVRLEAVLTAWGSSVFHFTTDSGATPTFPRRNVLVDEDSTIQARSVVVSFDGKPFPDEPVVIAYKPVPDATTGTVVGALEVGAGRMLVCQYRLVRRAAEGDAVARALLADLLRWAAQPRPPLLREDLMRPDGRTVRLYSWGEP